MTSEKALKEIKAIFEKEGINDWEIIGKSLILVDKTNMAVCYTIQYQITIDGILYPEKLSILVLEE